MRCMFSTIEKYATGQPKNKTAATVWHGETSSLGSYKVSFNVILLESGNNLYIQKINNVC